MFAHFSVFPYCDSNEMPVMLLFRKSTTCKLELMFVPRFREPSKLLSLRILVYTRESQR